MRRFLAIFGLLALMAAPYAEFSHGHSLGQIHDDCPACQVKSNPGVQIRVITDTVGHLSYHAAVLSPPSTPQASDDPLDVAPKTSPPSFVA